ncbi:hypothetical protein FOXG_00958 [Fusarium oxysporum f. sp. lycopersici 4287]|nr:hypothetical protein FOXG_00958 [Fusarium oxysporum f. sp. lycopersici 4287]XP_018233392.1 hypothetical protein FOXG_00958 [Fusarium oxysporum f. sp. lycopersici 4287]XP_018233393.1 hypothetical protein FOXG_00958 [Fusarium oxysporum f. sp. lycopersici 4287]XP_018233394.1 hypothetical protein FOXG_00958 [Fusarium oxysporum f. sp. lycopersici 4287]KNA95345.1 hypothetical protein FOXG_00958 [Fusarium oxysporum f. sp. lycopersici 4287]KNA95346.1 hypothetical protein FOXG_00958 [Fusarium oxyspo
MVVAAAVATAPVHWAISAVLQTSSSAAAMVVVAAAMEETSPRAQESSLGNWRRALCTRLVRRSLLPPKITMVIPTRAQAIIREASPGSLWVVLQLCLAANTAAVDKTPTLAIVLGNSRSQQQGRWWNVLWRGTNLQSYGLSSRGRFSAPPRPVVHSYGSPSPNQHQQHGSNQQYGSQHQPSQNQTYGSQQQPGSHQPFNSHQQQPGGNQQYGGQQHSEPGQQYSAHQQQPGQNGPYGSHQQQPGSNQQYGGNSSFGGSPHGSSNNSFPPPPPGGPPQHGQNAQQGQQYFPPPPGQQPHQPSSGTGFPDVQAHGGHFGGPSDQHAQQSQGYSAPPPSSGNQNFPPPPPGAPPGGYNPSYNASQGNQQSYGGQSQFNSGAPPVPHGSHPQYGGAY